MTSSVHLPCCRCWFDLSAPGCAGLQLTLPLPWPVDGAFTVLLWFCLEALPERSTPPVPPASSPSKWWAKREPPATPLARLYSIQLDEGDDGFSSVDLFVSGDGALVVHSQQVRLTIPHTTLSTPSQTRGIVTRSDGAPCAVLSGGPRPALHGSNGHGKLR
jgi:hypothetical protein